MAALLDQPAGLDVIGTDAAVLLPRPTGEIEVLGATIPGQSLLAALLPHGNVHLVTALGLVECHPVVGKPQLAIGLPDVAPHLLAGIVRVGDTAPEQGGTEHDDE